MTDKESSWNVLVTTLAHVGLLLIGVFLLFFGIFTVGVSASCLNVSSCDPEAFAIADVLVRAGVLIPFGLSVIVSAVLLMGRKTAWYVSIVAVVVMLLCVAAGILIAGYAQYSG